MPCPRYGAGGKRSSGLLRHAVEDYDNALKIEPENRNYLEGRDTFARLAQSTSEADASTTASTESTPSPTPSSIPCYKCQSEVAQGAKFCPECGEPTGVKRCTQCQNELGPGAKFCPECGAAVTKLHSTQGIEAISYPSEEESNTLVGSQPVNVINVEVEQKNEGCLAGCMGYLVAGVLLFLILGFIGSQCA